MLSNYNIRYPLIYNKLNGIKDITVSFFGNFIKPVTIDGCFIKAVNRSTDQNTQVDIYTFTLSLKLTDFSTGDAVYFDFPCTMNALTKTDISENDVNNILNGPFYAVTFMEGIADVFANTLRSFAGSRNSYTFSNILEYEIEPCCVCLATSKPASITYQVKKTDSTNVITEYPFTFVNNIILENIDTNTYRLYGKSNTIDKEIEKGINSINGISGSSLTINVSDSLLIENDGTKNTITISHKSTEATNGTN